MRNLCLDAADWAMIEAQLPPDWRYLASEYHVAGPVRPQLGAKLTDPAITLRLILHHVATNTSLKMTAALAAAVGLVDVSAVALHKKMRKAGPFLWELIRRLTPEQSDFAAERWAGYEVILLDGTTVTRPGAQGSTARVQYALRACDVALVQVQVSDDKGGETFRWVTARPGQLWVGDRCYANPPGVAALKAQGADALVRYVPGTLPLRDLEGGEVDVLSTVKQLKRAGQIGDWAVQVVSAKTEPIVGRLCAVRLPRDKAQQNRKRLRREYGQDVSPTVWALADFVVVFTTVPPERMSAVLLLELYRIRWQVELRIKRDKSLGHLDELPNFRKDTIQSWLCAKLLTQLLVARIASERVAFPPCAAAAP